MTYDVKYKASKDGNSAETTVVLAEIQHKDFKELVPATRVLEVTTRKSNGNLVTIFSASVLMKKDGYSTRTMEIFGDFFKTLRHPAGSKATEKTIRALHDEALKILPDMIGQAKVFYADKEAKAIAAKAAQ